VALSPESVCKPQKCAEKDFREWARRSFSLTSDELDSMVAAYADEVAIGSYSRWYWMMVHAGADQWTGCMSRRTASWFANVGQRAYFYRWSYAPEGPNGVFPRLAHHACEQPFIFHVLQESPRQVQESGGVYHISPREVTLSAALVQYWQGMAINGTPTGSVEWPVFNDSSRAGLEILNYTGTMFAPKANLHGAQCDFWDRYFEKALFSATPANEYDKKYTPAAIPASVFFMMALLICWMGRQKCVSAQHSTTKNLVTEPLIC